MRVNHDADHSRLIEKYGVKTPISFRVKIPKVGIIPHAVKPEQSRWVKIHVEFLRWKKTEDYQKWRKLQFAKQNGICYYCDISLKYIRTNVEHIIPKSRGGTNKKNNLVLACWKCNKDKNTKVLSKKKRKALRVKHNSKTKAFNEQLRLAAELGSKF